MAKAQELPEEALPEPLQNLIDMPGYRKVFKEIKALVQEVSTEKGLSAELLASRRQINQLLNWHWQLKSGNGRPELISWLAKRADGRSSAGVVKRIPALSHSKKPGQTLRATKSTNPIAQGCRVYLAQDFDSSVSGKVTFNSRIEISPSRCSS